MGGKLKAASKMNSEVLINLLPYKPIPTGLSRYSERLIADWNSATGETTPQQLRINMLGRIELSREKRLPPTQKTEIGRWCQNKGILPYLVNEKKLVKQVKPDIIYSPYPLLTRGLSNHLQIITCHDLTPLYFPNSKKAYWYTKYWMLNTLQRAGHVIAISKFVANQLIENGITPSKITVIKNGIEQLKDPIQIPSTNNFLVLARHSKNKNIQQALKGYACFLKTRPSWEGKLVIVGAEGKETKNLKLLESELCLSERIEWIPFLKEKELEANIRQAFCLISTSQMEGFDYPLLEAQVRGIPTIASSIPVHHEMHENKSLFYNLDENGQSLGEVLTRLVSEQYLWGEVSRAGLDQGNLFSSNKQIKDIRMLLESQSQ
jgi:glycosyltransferase involved in cell wall biosynthesis